MYTLINPIMFVGGAPEQVDEFLANEINPVLEANKDLLTQASVQT
jgi:adenylosuccinate lyase